VFTFFLETERGEKIERALKAIAAMQNLAEFLEQCASGGSAIASRWSRKVVPDDHDGAPGLMSYLESRAVRPNRIARNSSRLILVQVSLPMIAS
jgi:hypothetical protein